MLQVLRCVGNSPTEPPTTYQISSLFGLVNQPEKGKHDLAFSEGPNPAIERPSLLH
jgi:hypothetical protein